jgi:hypothetical protein
MKLQFEPFRQQLANHLLLLDHVGYALDIRQSPDIKSLRAEPRRPSDNLLRMHAIPKRDDVIHRLVLDEDASPLSLEPTAVIVCFQARYIGGQQDALCQGLGVGIHRLFAQRDTVHIPTAARADEDVPTRVNRIEGGIGVCHRPPSTIPPSFPDASSSCWSHTAADVFSLSAMSA